MKTKIECSYCGQVAKQIRFWIGAAPQVEPLHPLYKEQEYTLHEGTGKYSCANCRPKGEAESTELVRRLKGDERGRSLIKTYRIKELKKDQYIWECQRGADIWLKVTTDPFRKDNGWGVLCHDAEFTYTELWENDDAGIYRLRLYREPQYGNPQTINTMKGED